MRPAFYDAVTIAGSNEAVRASIGTEWLRITGRIPAENPIWFSLLVWRMRELIHAGTLECRGEANRIGLPARYSAPVDR